MKFIRILKLILALLSITSVSLDLSANQDSGATNSALTKDQNYTLTNIQGNNLQARILHLEESALFIRPTDNSIFKMELDQLSASSRSLVDDWNTQFGGDITLEQLSYLQNLGKSPLEKLQKAPEKTDTVANAHDSTKPFLIEPDQSIRWQPIEMLTDEFEGESINGGKWQHDFKPWDDQRWSADNTWVDDGMLHLRARCEPHTGSDGVQYFYKLGILLSNSTTTYGYYEAKIKGCNQFPGVSPSAWLYSDPTQTSSSHPEISYASIDLARLQMAEYKSRLSTTTDVNYVALNLETHFEKEGHAMLMRSDTHPEICDNGWQAPWDPSEDFHIYAVESTPEKITWYIDGLKVSEQPNSHWHLPMNFSFSIGLRPPYIEWGGNSNRLPAPEASTAEGFPTEMQVEYIRAWVRER